MAAKNCIILRFVQGAPVWERLEGGRLTPAQEPGGASRIPVMALLPDDLFFFHRPTGLGGVGGRAKVNAARLQEGYLFPPAEADQERGVMRAAGGDVLAFATAPELRDFWQRRRQHLERANVVTTGFVLAHAAGALEEGPWFWRGWDEARAVFDGEHLHYFTGGEEALAGRLAALESSAMAGAAPRELTWPDMLRVLADQDRSWASLRLPLQSFGDTEGGDPRRWARVFAAIAAAGLLFCLGEFWRAGQVRERVRQWEERTRAAYTEVLGPEQGADPFGKLLFTLDSLRGSSFDGVKATELLTLLSQAAPEGFVVTSISLGDSEAVVKAKAASYESVEVLMTTLQNDGRYRFVLDQATTGDAGVNLSLKVEAGA